MIDTVIHSSLGAVLERHNIKPYGLWKAIRTRYGLQGISRPTVYAIVGGNNGMPDQRTLNQIMHALSDLTGEAHELGDIFKWMPDPAPTAPAAAEEK